MSVLMQSKLKKVYDILGKDIPSIDIDGKWLIDIGFDIGKYFVVDYNIDYIYVSAIKEENYLDFVNAAKRQTDNISNLKLVRKIAKSKRGFPRVMIQGKFLEKIGFKIGTDMLFQYKYGVIHIRALHL